MEWKKTFQSDMCFRLKEALGLSGFYVEKAEADAVIAAKDAETARLTELVAALESFISVVSLDSHFSECNCLMCQAWSKIAALRRKE